MTVIWLSWLSEYDPGKDSTLEPPKPKETKDWREHVVVFAWFCTIWFAGLLVEAQMTWGNDRHSWKDWQAKSGKVVDREFHLERDWESVWICWIRACATLQIQCWNMVERFADAFDAMGELWIIGRCCYLHVALNGGVESIQVSIFDIQDIHE